MKLQSAEEWLKEPEFEGVEILDPDGWDRSNFETSWAEPITREEFERRLMMSTSSFPPGFFDPVQ